MPPRSAKPGGFHRSDDVTSSARAGVGPSSGQQLIKRRAIQVPPLRLPDGGRIRMKSERTQLGKDLGVRLWHASGDVGILDPHQPAPAMRSGVQPAGECRDKRSSVQGAGG